MLHADLTHGGMARAGHPAAVRKQEMGPAFFQQQNSPLHRNAFSFGEPIPPGSEFIRDLDIPCHTKIII